MTASTRSPAAAGNETMTVVNVLDFVRGLAMPYMTISEHHRALAASVAIDELIKADLAFDLCSARRIGASNRITGGDRSDAAFREQANADHAYDRAAERRAAALANVGASP